MKFLVTWFHFLVVSFLLVNSHICDCRYNDSIESLQNSTQQDNGHSDDDRPVAAALVLADDIAIAACQTVWLNKLHRATYGSPADMPFLLPPQLPSTNVTLTVDIKSVTQITPSAVSIGVSLMPHWRDARFGWDLKLDCPLTSVVLRSNKIWRPTFSLADSATDRFVAANNYPLVVTALGKITFSHPVTADVICLLTVRLFPYDYQHCRLVIKPEHGNGMERLSSVQWNFDTSRDVDTNDLITALTQSNWHLNGIQGHVSSTNDGYLSIFFRLERRNSFAFNLWLITSIFLTLLVCSSLGLEPSSVEKMVTSFLAVVGYLGQLTLLLHVLPVDFSGGTDATVPMLLDFSLVQFVIGVSAVGLNGIVVNRWFLAVKKAEELRNLSICCSNLPHATSDSTSKVCMPSTSGQCVEEFATISHCSKSVKIFHPRSSKTSSHARIHPTSSEAAKQSEPIEMSEKASITVCPVNALGSTDTEVMTADGKKCRRSYSWLNQTLLIGYFITMLVAYSIFIVIMIISIAQAKAASPISYFAPV